MLRLPLLVLFIFTVTFSPMQKAEASNAKLKAMGIMAVYGTVGGALLGTATLAFEGRTRNIARGASLGLYAGLLFGSFVILSHTLKDYQWSTPSEDYYPESEDQGVEKGEQVNGGYSLKLDRFSTNQRLALLSTGDIQSKSKVNFIDPKDRLPLFYLDVLKFRF